MKKKQNKGVTINFKTRSEDIAKYDIGELTAIYSGIKNRLDRYYKAKVLLLIRAFIKAYKEYLKLKESGKEISKRDFKFVFKYIDKRSYPYKINEDVYTLSLAQSELETATLRCNISWEIFQDLNLDW